MKPEKSHNFIIFQAGKLTEFLEWVVKKHGKLKKNEKV